MLLAYAFTRIARCCGRPPELTEDHSIETREHFVKLACPVCGKTTGWVSGLMEIGEAAVLDECRRRWLTLTS